MLYTVRFFEYTPSGFPPVASATGSVPASLQFLGTHRRPRVLGRGLFSALGDGGVGPGTRAWVAAGDRRERGEMSSI